MKNVLIILIASIALTACGGASSSFVGSSIDGGGTDQGGVNPDLINPGDAELPEDYSYTAKSEPLAVFGMNQERQILHFDVASKILQVSIPFPTLGVLQVSGEVPGRPGVSFYTDLQNQSLVFEIPLEEYLDLLQSNTTLPDGRPIPGVPGGELPLLGFQLPNTSLDTTIYLGKDYLAFFMESDFNLPLNLTGNILNEDGSSIVGLLGWVAAKDGFKGGAFVSLRLPRELVAYIASLQ